MDKLSAVGYQEFTEWEKQLVKEKAKEKVRGLKRPAIGQEDLEQEFFLHIWLKRSHYDPHHASRASLKTFLNRILDHKFLDIVKFEKQDRRAIHGIMDSLDKELISAEDDNLTLGDTIPEGQQFVKRVNDSYKLTDIRHALDVADSKLTEIQRTIIKLIAKGHGIAEIAQKTKKPWSTLKNEITKMRTVLYDTGLADFVGVGDLSKKRRMGE